jgi:hypothetical protein
MNEHKVPTLSEFLASPDLSPSEQQVKIMETEFTYGTQVILALAEFWADKAEADNSDDPSNDVGVRMLERFAREFADHERKVI